MGINVLNNTSSQEIITTAGANITSGDLIINAESGFAFAASNALTIAQNNNTTAGTSALTANTNTGSSNFYGGIYYSSSKIRTCQLSNGTLVTGYAGNGTGSSTNNVNIVFKTLLNGAPVGAISISQSGVYWVLVRALSTGFVVLWANGSSELRFAIYNNSGTAILSSTVVSGGVYNASNSECFDIRVTSNNEIVIAYSISSNGLRFKRYNSSGVLQGTETTVEASITGNYIAINPDTSGGFWIYYYREQASAAWKFAIYNSSGTLQGALVTVASTGSTLSYGDFDSFTTRLTGGNVVLMGPTAASGIPNAYVYNSSGTLITTIDFAGSDTGFAANQSIPGICLTGTGFTIFARGSNSPGYFWVYDANGGQLRGRTQTSFTSWGSGSTSAFYETYSKLFSLGNAGYVVLNGYYDSGNALNYLTLLCFTSSGTTVGSSTTIINAASTRFGQISSVLTSDGSVYYAYISNAGNSQNFYGMYAVQRKSVIGVAQNTVSANSSVRIATTGSYTINSDFFAGGNFDQRTATVPGTKGTVTGTSAVLFGMS
jgi:hypothetical protein